MIGPSRRFSHLLSEIQASETHLSTVLMAANGNLLFLNLILHYSQQSNMLLFASGFHNDKSQTWMARCWTEGMSEMDL